MRHGGLFAAHKAKRPAPSQQLVKVGQTSARHVPHQDVTYHVNTTRATSRRRAHVNRSRLHQHTTSHINTSYDTAVCHVPHQHVSLTSTPHAPCQHVTSHFNMSHPTSTRHAPRQHAMSHVKTSRPRQDVTSHISTLGSTQWRRDALRSPCCIFGRRRSEECAAASP